MENLDYRETVFSSAINHWWNSKDENVAGISRSQGTGRDGNLAGNTMEGFRRVICEKLIAAGISESDIFSGGHLSKTPANLPSYFRASKNWDIVICKHSIYKKVSDGLFSEPKEPQLIAAIEFKSQQDSIGNNQNNRMEESIGNAVDFWASYENLNFVHLRPRPWLGYLFVGKYAEADIGKPVNIKQPHFLADEAFAGREPAFRLRDISYPGPSYAERYRIFLERMIGKKMYDSACFITTNESIKDKAANYHCLYPTLSGDAFVDDLMRHVSAYYFDRR